MDWTRRETLLATMAGSAALLTGASTPTSTPTPAPVAGPLPGAGGGTPDTTARWTPRTVVPLPFKPSQLTGLSERMIVSHHDKNYAAAVKGLNTAMEQAKALTPDTPGFALAGLQQSILQFTNSIIHHEHYFSNLGGDGKAGAGIRQDIAAAFGSFDAWDTRFRAVGRSLGGGSGWAVLWYDFHTESLEIHGSSHHTQALAWGRPLLVMDLYEHAYQMDYGADAARYVDAFMANVQWDEVSRRWEQARRMAALLRG